VYMPLLPGLLIASAVTAVFAWVLSQLCEKWERKFAGLRADHPLRDAAEETAMALGGAVFLVARGPCGRPPAGPVVRDDAAGGVKRRSE
jgi:hypothetical protein